MADSTNIIKIKVYDKYSNTYNIHIKTVTILSLCNIVTVTLSYSIVLPPNHYFT